MMKEGNTFNLRRSLFSANIFPYVLCAMKASPIYSFQFIQVIRGCYDMRHIFYYSYILYHNYMSDMT